MIGPATARLFDPIEKAASHARQTLVSPWSVTSGERPGHVVADETVQVDSGGSVPVFAAVDWGAKSFRPC